MRRSKAKAILAVLAVLTAAAPVAAQVPAQPEPGAEAPAVPARILPAEEFRLADYAGKVVLLDFWASWCKPCRKSIPWLSGVQDRLGERGLVVVAVNLDTDIAAAKDMVAALGAQVVVVADPQGALAQTYDLQGMPTSLHFDRQGRLAQSHVGFTPQEAEAREAEILKLLEGEAP